MLLMFAVGLGSVPNLAYGEAWAKAEKKEEIKSATTL